MNNNLKKPPDWWIHDLEHWIELSSFFSFVQVNQITDKNCWKKLSTGQSNHNYRLDVLTKNTSKSYFVQLVNLDNQVLLPAVNPLAVIQQLDRYPKLQPWLVSCHLNTNSVRIFEWIDHSSISPSSFHDQFFSSIVDFLTQLHSENISTNTLSEYPMINITEHLQRYRRLALLKTPDSSRQIEDTYQQAVSLTSNFVPNRLCHNDLSLSNFLWDKHQNQLKVVDWEYACYSDPVMDIAGLIINCHFNEHQEKHFLENCLSKDYLEQIDLKPPFEKLSDMKQLSERLSRLWQFAHHQKH